MIGGGAGDAELAFDRVQPVHRPVLGPTAGGPGAVVHRGGGVVAQRVRVEAEDHVRLRQIHDRPRRARGGGQRGVFAPGRPGGSHLLAEPPERRRAGRFAQHRRLARPVAQRPVERPERVVQRGLVRPGHHRAAAVRIVEVQEERLIERAARPAAVGVVGVPLDLDRATVDAADQQAAADAVEFPGGGEQLRDAGQAAGAAAGRHRHQLLVLPPAAGHAGERQGGPHHLQPATAVEPDRFVGLLRKLTVQERFELRRVPHLVQAAPVTATVGAVGRPRAGGRPRGGRRCGRRIGGGTGTGHAGRGEQRANGM